MSDAPETARDCERITVTLVPKTAAALARLCARRLTKTDVINRAVVAYDFLEEQVAAGADLLVRHPDGTVLEVRFL